MRNSIAVAAVVVALALTGCATNPMAIQPTYVDQTLYANMPCGELRRTIQESQADLDDLIDRQKKKRRIGIALNVLIIPGLGAATGDHETQIGRLKGALIALNAEANRRCQSKE